MFVKIECKTCRVGCDDVRVYEFPDDTTEDELQAYTTDCARDNADMYGIIDDAIKEAENSDIEFDEDSCYYGNYEILHKSEEKIVEEYGYIYTI